MQEKQKIPAQKLYYGWYIVWALAITETLSYGVIYYAFTVFITPMQAQMGWTLSQITGAFSLGLLVSGFATLPVGTWLDKYGARFLMTVASVLATLLLIAWSFVQTLPLFYAIWVLLGVTMAMLFYDPAFVVVANWFSQKRGTALAIVTFVAGFASTIFLPLADYLLNQFGWRVAVLILAIVFGAITIPLHAIVLRRRPQDMDLQPDGKLAHSEDEEVDIPETSIPASEAIRSRSFLWLTVAFGLSTLASISIRVHFIPYAITTGIDATTAAWLAGFIGITQVIGRLVFAPLEVHFSSKTVTVVTMATLALSFVILIVSQSLLFVGAFVLVFGMAFGAMTLVRPVILAELYGIAEYGRINSMMAFIMMFVITAAPIGTGILFEWFGSYQPVLWILAFIALLSVTAIIKLPTEKRKKHRYTPIS